MKNTLRTGAALALVVVVIAALLGAYALNGNLSNANKGSSGDATIDPLNEGNGRSEGLADGSSDADDVPGGPDPASPTPTPGSGNDPPDKLVRLEHMRFPSVLAAGHSDRYDVIVYHNDGSFTEYTGDLVLVVDISPSAGQLTGPSPGQYPGEYWFTLSIDQPGDYTVTVTPYDSNGNVIGDPYQSVVKVRTLGSIVSFSTNANMEGNYTYFVTGLTLMQIGIDWHPPVGVSKFVLGIDGESQMGNQGFRGDASWGGIIRLPNSDYTPGAAYTITAYDFNGQVLATTGGTAPG